MTKNIIVVFVAADSADAEAKTGFLKHLSLIENICITHQTPPGTDVGQWLSDIATKADIVIPLLSADFLINEQLFQAVITINIDRHKDGEAVMLPVLISDCLWEPVFQDTSVSVLPKDKIPLLSRRRVNFIWKEIAETVRFIAKYLALKYENSELKYENSELKFKLQKNELDDTKYRNN